MMTKLISTILCICALASGAFSQKIINASFGPIWLWERTGQNLPAKSLLNVTLEGGRMFDKVVGVGVQAEFGWDRTIDESSWFDTTSQTLMSRPQTDMSRYYFPISGFLLLDPLSKQKLHPIIKGSFGLNMMARRNRVYTYSANGNANATDTSGHGFYIGIIGRVNADAMYDIGAHASIFAGASFQWGRLYRKSDLPSGADYHIRQFGPGIRGGLSILF